MERKVYFHDVLRALTDANLQNQFAVYVEKKQLRCRHDYDALYDIGWERGMQTLYDQIMSGEFADELQRL
jgi:hypothetical protein